MKLYTLISSQEVFKKKRTYQLLSTACSELDIELILIELDSNYFDPDSSAELIELNQAWLRLAVGKNAALAEKILIREDLSTVYEPWRLKLLGALWDDTLLMMKQNLSIIPTVFLFGGLDDKNLNKVVEGLGGFPVVLKATGLSHGRGLQLCKSLDDLRTHLSGVDPIDYWSVVLRKFIPDARHIRAVVIGARCVDAIEYEVQPGDFRTNAVKIPTAQSIEISSEVKELAVAAARANGVLFAGVDILIDRHNNHFVAELNVPCNFARNYLTNGKNLATDLIDLLAASIDKK